MWEGGYLNMAHTPGSSRLEALLSFCQVLSADHQGIMAVRISPRACCQVAARSCMQGSVCQHPQISCIVPLCLSSECLPLQSV